MSSAFGRYRLLERLGQGGMAEVFKAKSFGVEGFEKILVIKRILPELACRPDFAEMFIHEAKLAVRLSHANIVQVFDLGMAHHGEQSSSAEPDAYYIAMEYVQGVDLARVLARCRRQQIALPIQLCAFVASEVAKGLDHAHRRRDDRLRPLGIVHRDVSPQNVLLSLEGEVKITDFGIAKACGPWEHDAPDDMRAKALQGKFGYMSPEQSRGESVDARSDLFSLGTTIYECVAGVNPFSAPTTFETVRRVQACEYPPLVLLRPDVQPELVAILETAMAESPADRYADAGRMYEALLAFLYGQGSRYGAHDLAEFLSQFQDAGEAAGIDTTVEPMLETEGGPGDERIPVDVPSTSTPVAPAKEVRSSGDASGRFVGRKEELRRIGEVLALSAKRRARVVTIRGERGVGKTRLLCEIERRLRRGRYDIGFHIASCPPRGNDFPLSGAVCMLQVLCGTTEGDSPDRILAVHPRLRALGLQADEVDTVLMALAAGVATIARDANGLLSAAFARMVQSLCADRPHAFAWDVSHAMDPDSRVLLEEVLRRCGQTRLVLVFAARVGFSHALEKTQGHVAIDLSDLSAGEVERLVALRLAVDEAPDDLLRFVRARAGGSPLFIEEVIKALVDEGAVSIADRRVVSIRLVGQTAGDALPTIESVPAFDRSESAS